MVWHDQKCYIALHFNCLNLRKAVVPLTMPSASCDARASVNNVTWAKTHVAPYFDNLDLRNALVWLMILPASRDVDVSIIGTTWSRKWCCTPFWLSCCHLEPDDMPVALHDLKSHIAPHFSCHALAPMASHEQESQFCSVFQLSWPKKCNAAIIDADGIMWCKRQWCYMTKRDMLNSISIVFS